MKWITVAAPAVLLLITNGIANAGDDSYAIAAYHAMTTENVYVYGPLSTACNAERLKIIRDVERRIVPPSLVEIGYACASREQLARLNLNPPTCELVDSAAYGSNGSGWSYVCYRGIVDRFFAPPPTAAELEQQREAQEADRAARQQAAELATARATERAAWRRYAVDWAYQVDKAACLQKLRAHRMPGQDDPAPLCDSSARKRATGNPTMDLLQYCAYMRSTAQPKTAIDAACDTTANAPFNVLPPS